MARKPWNAEKIAREELRAQQLGDMQKFVMKSPLFPAACVVGFFLFVMFGLWAGNAVVDALL
jgi:hypothetical protein